MSVLIFLRRAQGESKQQTGAVQIFGGTWMKTAEGTKEYMEEKRSDAALEEKIDPAELAIRPPEPTSTKAPAHPTAA